jgi:hypothetical protein
LPIELKTGNVGQWTGAEAAALGQVHDIAKLAFEPFLFVRFDWYGGVTAIRPAAATRAITIRKMRPPLDDVNYASISPRYSLPVWCSHY